MSGTTLAARIAQVAGAFAGRSDLGWTQAGELEALVVDELGSLDIFERGVAGLGGRRKAVAPRSIYHVLASNLAVSAETSLLLGLILGSRLIFKLPGAGLPVFEATVAGLPEDLRARVKLDRNFDEEEMRACDAVVVYGADETIDFFRAKTTRKQRTLFYGHRISLGIVTSGAENLRQWAERAAGEVAAYDQHGCLSPQFYLVENPAKTEGFAELLAEALQKECRAGSGGELSFEEAAQRRHARRMLRGRGAKIWESDEAGGFTVALPPRPGFVVGPGNRFIQVGSAENIAEALREWKGSLSSISLAEAPGASWKRWEELAIELGASRLCTMGDLQKPPLSWRHDGRPRLADLVTWLSFD